MGSGKFLINPDLLQAVVSTQSTFFFFFFFFFLEATNPDLLEICQTPSICVFRIPPLARQEWAKTVQFVMRNAMHSNKDADWVHYFAMTRCCLQTPYRSGKKHTKSVADHIIASCKKFRSERWFELWEEYKVRIEKMKKGTPNVKNKVAKMVAEGRLSAACAALSAAPMAPFSEETFNLMRDLHPDEPEPDDTGPSPPHHNITEQTTYLVLKKFKKGAVASLTGLRHPF
eukprot:TRINITY_DN2752_c0_g1_i16.p1 TRINITY_DN2752_c0_g1~~TRINITY_DN2752_c0_g1_i16.p1  ORF type:complete len:229 (+),score=21.24 TRINITY_DN2752_c0_g1_i16:796-1482(+)